MYHVRRSLAAAALALGLAAPADAQNLLTNGSFDDIVANPAIVTTYTYSSGQHMGAWREVFGNVHLVCRQYWQAYDGNCSVDLDGSVRGWIQQDVVTTVGSSYQLTWEYAANDYVSRGLPRTFEVWWGDALGSLARVGSYSYSAAPGSSLTLLNWLKGTLSGLQATSTLSRLQFRSTTPGAAYVGWGAVIDAVDLEQEAVIPPTTPPLTTVPEPMSVVLVGTGLVAVMGLGRRRARRA